MSSPNSGGLSSSKRRIVKVKVNGVVCYLEELSDSDDGDDNGATVSAVQDVQQQPEIETIETEVVDEDANNSSNSLQQYDTTEEMDVTATASAKKGSGKHVWNDSETRTLLSLYEEYYPMVLTRELKCKVDMWKLIAQKLQLDFRQCENRLKTLKREALKLKKKTTSSPEKAPRRTWADNYEKYEKQLETILSGKDTLKQQVMTEDTDRSRKRKIETTKSDIDNELHELKMACNNLRPNTIDDALSNINAIATDKVNAIEKHKWTESETRYLISLHAEYLPMVESRQLKSQAHMWKVISQKLRLDHVQCENRFKNLKRRDQLRHYSSESIEEKSSNTSTPFRSKPSVSWALDVPVNRVKKTTASAALIECNKTLINIHESIKEKRTAQLELYREEIESARRFREEILNKKEEKLARLKEFLAARK